MRFVRLMLAASPLGTSALAALVCLRALLPVGYMLSVGALVSAVASGGTIVAPLAVLGALVVLQEVAESAQELLASEVTRRVNRATSRAVLDGALNASVASMETPDTAHRIGLALGNGPGGMPAAAGVSALAQLGASRLSGLAAGLTLAWYAWWAPLPLAAAWLFTGGWLDREVRAAVRGFSSDTAALRRATYLRDLGLLPGGSKELRVFGLGAWLVERFTGAWADGMREVLAHRQSAGALAGRLACLTGAHLAAFVALGLNAGPLGVGELTVAVQAVLGMAALGYVGDAQWTLANAVSTLPHVSAVRELAPGPDSRGGRPAAGLPAGEIRFEGVGFGYPGVPVLDEVDLVIPAGRSLALVGGNGEGKTTLLKLLARLHDPDRGRITVDGADLGELDPESWRRQVAVVFQDFCRFEMTLRDNIRYGAVHAPADDVALLEALRAAGAGDLVHRLPHGLDTIMSRQYDGGAELSGGQWQKVALARAIHAVRQGARVLVLDEPTAHLDVRAESRLHERFLELTEGVTTILVSHRFSTVRMADRIAVLRGGRIVEQGGHAELCLADGDYARMYRVQASHFQQPEAADA